MTWQVLYPVFPDEATARGFARQLGVEPEPGQVSAASHNYSFTVFTQWNRRPGTNGAEDDGEAAEGFWVLSAFNTSRPEGLAAYNAVLASGCCQTPENPSNVFAGAV
jgi:hypothetical protein